MVNIENFKRLRAALTPDPETGKSPVIPGLGFNMIDLGARVGVASNPHSSNYSYTNVEDHLDACGTVACMGGWCYALSHPELVQDDGTILIPSIHTIAGNRVVSEATAFLGLTGAEAYRLFKLSNSHLSIASIPLERALAAIDRIIKTGEVEAW